MSYGAVGSGAEVPPTRAASPQPVLLLVRGLGDGGLDPAFAQVGADGELVWISDPIQGARHDVFCLDESRVLDTLNRRDWTGDKGYVGRDMLTPIKKTKEPVPTRHLRHDDLRRDRTDVLLSNLKWRE